MRDHAYVLNVDGAVVRDGEYLLVERAAAKDHAAGALAFPGGRVEASPGVADPIEATARRELREEVGVEVGDVEYVCSRTFEDDRGTRCCNVVTLCERVGGEAHPRATDEVAAVHRLSPAEIAAAEDAPRFLSAYVDRVETHL
jgi:8-oxo-dGTP diphosphatase